MIPCEYRHKWYTVKTRFFGLHFTRRMYRWTFNHFYVIGPKASEFGEITQTTRPLRCWRSLKVTDFGTNRKRICDFLLVINTNLPPILHRFQVMADYWSNFRYGHGNVSLWRPSYRVIPCEYSDKLYLSRNQNDFPTWNWKPHDRIFIRLDTIPERDGQRDRQTDGQNPSS